MKRIAVISIIIKGDRSVSADIQKLLSKNADIIIARLGIPDLQNNLSIISLVVKAENERLSALTGSIGRLNNVVVKSAITSVEIE